MTFQVPSALWWLVVTVPIVAAFLYRRRVVEVVVPAITFWQPSPRRRRFGGFGRRVRRWLSLLIHVAVVVLLAAALARPSILGPIAHLAIVLDDSATMQTREDAGLTRFELALGELRRRVYAKPDSVRVSLILAGNPPRVLQRPTDDPDSVLESAESVRPRDVEPAIDEALALAHRLTPADSTRTLLITDQSDRTFDATLADEHIWIGSDRPNVGIRDAALAVDDVALDVFLTQRRRSGTAAVVKLIVDGQTAAHETALVRDLGAVVRLRPALPAGKSFEIVVEPPDDFDLDNRFYGVWPARQDTRVQLVSAGNDSLVATLEQPDISLSVVEEAEWVPSQADITILDAPADGPGRPFAGRFVVLGGGDPFGIVKSAPIARDLRPSQWAPRSPFLKDLDLMGWRIRRSAGVNAPSGAQVLVESGKTPLLFLVERRLGSDPSGEKFAALYANFNLPDTNLERSAGLAILLWNAMEALQGRRPEDVAIAHHTGVPISFPAPSSADATIRTPTGESLLAYRDGDRLVLPFPEKAGFYELTTPAGVVLRAVNCPAQPDFRQSYVSAARVETASVPSAAWFSLPLWARAVLLALAVAVAELLAFHSRLVRID